MFKDYKQNVLIDYRNKVANDKLIHLVELSPALLRDECLNVLKEREQSKNDFILLRTIFGAAENEKDYLKIIGDYPISKLKSLSNFLKGEPVKPDRKNIELLAWLIDYQPRPYQEGDPYDISKVKVKTPGAPTKHEPNDEESSIANNQQTKSGKKDGISNTEKITVAKIKNKVSLKPLLLVCIIALIVGRIAFYLWNQKVNQIRMPLPGEKCMYWTGNHYEPVKCDAYIAGATIIPLDLMRLKNQQKIPAVKLVTKTELKQAWYTKIDGEPELYRDSGVHPIDTTKKLRPLSQYMINKYDLDKRFFQKYLGWAYYVILFLLISRVVYLSLKKKHIDTPSG